MPKAVLSRDTCGDSTKVRNPKTNRCISIGGKIYNELIKEGYKFSSSGSVAEKETKKKATPVKAKKTASPKYYTPESSPAKKGASRTAKLGWQKKKPNKITSPTKYYTPEGSSNNNRVSSRTSSPIKEVETGEEMTDSKIEKLEKLGIVDKAWRLQEAYNSIKSRSRSKGLWMDDTDDEEDDEGIMEKAKRRVGIKGGEIVSIREYYQLLQIQISERMSKKWKETDKRVTGKYKMPIWIWADFARSVVCKGRKEAQGVLKRPEGYIPPKSSKYIKEDASGESTVSGGDDSFLVALDL